MASVISGDANVSATEFGYLDGVTSALQTQMDAKAPLASPTFTGTPELPDGTTLAGSLLTSGKILQIVRATDTTNRATSSTSYVDAVGSSVTITPTKSTSAILILWAFRPTYGGGASLVNVQITDSSNNPVSGAEDGRMNVSNMVMVAYATPATTSAVTYKGRFKTNTGNANIRGDESTTQMFALELSA